MIALPPGVRVWLACGRTDMRKGMDGLAMLVHLAESGDSVPRWVSRKCNMLPKSALLRLWRGSRGSIRYAKALLASKGRETHAGSQGSIDSTFA
jgi:hypothetical protein